MLSACFALYNCIRLAGMPPPVTFVYHLSSPSLVYLVCRSGVIQFTLPYPERASNTKEVFFLSTPYGSRTQRHTATGESKRHVSLLPSSLPRTETGFSLGFAFLSYFSARATSGLPSTPASASRSGRGAGAVLPMISIFRKVRITRSSDVTTKPTFK